MADIPDNPKVDIRIEGLFILCYDSANHKFEVNPVISKKPSPVHTLSVEVREVDSNTPQIINRTLLTQDDIAAGLNIFVQEIGPDAQIHGHDYIDPADAATITDQKDFGFIINFNRIHSVYNPDKTTLRKPIIIKNGDFYTAKGNDSVNYRLTNSTNDSFLGRRTIIVGSAINLLSGQTLVLEPISGLRRTFPFKADSRYVVAVDNSCCNHPPFIDFGQFYNALKLNSASEQREFKVEPKSHERLLEMLRASDEEVDTELFPCIEIFLGDKTTIS